MRIGSRARTAVMALLFVASAGWVTWLVLTAILPDQLRCGESLVVEAGCWTTAQVISVVMMVAGSGILFGSLIAMTFRLAIAEPPRRSPTFTIARAAALAGAVATGIVLVIASFDAYRQSTAPEDAAAARCGERLSADDARRRACIFRELQRSEAELFVRRLPLIAAIAAGWSVALLVGDRARRYRSPEDRAHSSR